MIGVVRFNKYARQKFQLNMQQKQQVNIINAAHEKFSAVEQSKTTMNKWQQQKVKGYNKNSVKKGDKREVRGVVRAKTEMQAKNVTKSHKAYNNKAALKSKKSLEELKMIGLSK